VVEDIFGYGVGKIPHSGPEVGAKYSVGNLAQRRIVMSEGEFCAKDLTLGRANALVKKLGGMEVVDGILAETLKFTIEAVVEQKKSVLRLLAEFVLPEQVGNFNPQQFFRTRSGLCVWDDFKDLVLKFAKPVSGVVATTIRKHELVKPANDSQIRSGLPEGHVFQASELCGHLAGMILRQPNGGAGQLLNNGYANLFYVQVGSEVVVVGVLWSAGYRRWSVFAFQLDVSQWRAGRQVLSRATAG